MTAFVLKIIALTAMLIDHTGATFPDHTPLYFRVIGRLTFPIFVYLLAEGFRHTRSPGKFLLRLFAFALISQPFFDWSLNRSRHISAGYSPWRVDFLNNTNIFYTLFLGGLAIVAFQWIRMTLTQRLQVQSDDGSQSTAGLPDWLLRLVIFALAALPTAGFMWIAEYLSADYGNYGVLFIFLMYVIKSPKWLMLMVFAVMNVLQHRALFPFFIEGIRIPWEFYLMIPATLLTVPLIAMYNGKRGPSMKWLFYAAYPAHLAVLATLAFLL